MAFCAGKLHYSNIIKQKIACDKAVPRSFQPAIQFINVTESEWERTRRHCVRANLTICRRNLPHKERPIPFQRCCFCVRGKIKINTGPRGSTTVFSSAPRFCPFFFGARQPLSINCKLHTLESENSDTWHCFSLQLNFQYGIFFPFEWIDISLKIKNFQKIQRTFFMDNSK